jgi:hypothetical protein
MMCRLNKIQMTVPRDEKGRMQRRAAARHACARPTGYPHGRPGYVIDHVVSLACGCEQDEDDDGDWGCVND